MLQPLYSHYIAIVLVIYPIISPLYPTILYPHYIPNSHVWLYSVTFSSQILVAYIAHSDLFSALGDPNSHIPNPTTNSSDIKYMYISVYISVYIYVHIYIYMYVYIMVGAISNCIPTISSWYHHMCWLSHRLLIVKLQSLLVYIHIIGA